MRLWLCHVFECQLAVRKWFAGIARRRFFKQLANMRLARIGEGTRVSTLLVERFKLSLGGSRRRAKMDDADTEETPLDAIRNGASPPSGSSSNC
jgi:hypothetical protein